jgi:SAM-dependent methyltransferase
MDHHRSMPSDLGRTGATGGNGPSSLGRIFDEDAATYDEMRPSYPPVLFDDLVALSSLGSGARVLEIGPGTGQATEELARRGFDILALEPGADLARIANEKLRRFPRVRVEITTFEEWAPPPEPFDAVVAATSFHWLDPRERLRKSADVLRDGGLLAIVSTHHVAGGTADFFHDVQGCYERHMPGTDPGLRLPPADRLAPDTEELERADAFGRVRQRSYVHDVTYPTASYLRLLTTYSGHRALTDAARRALLDCIGRLIDERYAGQITKRYLFRLTTAVHERRLRPDQ